jgi:acetolactate synthase-1/2/3 large subunit
MALALNKILVANVSANTASAYYQPVVVSSVGAGNATAMLTLDNPALDWVSLAKGFGVAAGRATTLDDLAVQVHFF